MFKRNRHLLFSLKSLIRILKSITRKEERNVRLELFKILAEKYVAGQLRIGRKEKSIKGIDESFCLLYFPGLMLMNFRDELSNFWSIYNFRHQQFINSWLSDVYLSQKVFFNVETIPFNCCQSFGWVHLCANQENEDKDPFPYLYFFVLPSI